MPEKEYQRLTGTARKASLAYRETFRLWLGADHLLQVSSSYFTETYKRFYYKDIQGMSLQKTKKGFWLNLCLSIMILIIIGIGFLAGNGSQDSGFYVFLGIAATPLVILLICLIVNIARGPTCTFHIKTAVHLEELPSLNRLWKAKKAIKKIADQIHATQGELTSEHIISYQNEILQNVK
jgi:hypothetical protein